MNEYKVAEVIKQWKEKNKDYFVKNFKNPSKESSKSEESYLFSLMEGDNYVKYGKNHVQIKDQKCSQFLKMITEYVFLRSEEEFSEKWTDFMNGKRGKRFLKTTQEGFFSPKVIRDKNGDIAFFCNVHGDNDGRMMERITPILNLLPQEEWDRLGIRVVGKKLNLVDHISAYIAEGNHQIILTGAPGTGKTYSARKYVEKYVKVNYQDKFREHFCFVQFHPSYDYTDFVEGLRPVNLMGQKNTTYVRLDGIFKAFCRKVVEKNEPDKKFFFIIDEINRANLSKVFGELVYALEDSYRGEENKLLTQYSHFKTHRIITENDKIAVKKYIGQAVPLEKDVFADGFYIPENVYIIGTMNRDKEAFDFVLRRRFQWLEIKANDYIHSSLQSMILKNSADSDLNEMLNGMVDNIINMNQLIGSSQQLGLSEAHQIGAAYFKNIKSDELNHSSKLLIKLKNIFDEKIDPILREYTQSCESDLVEDFIRDCKKALLEVEE